MCECVGAVVRRGPDWDSTYGEEEGANGSTGIILSIQVRPSIKVTDNIIRALLIIPIILMSR
jgi:hypothetical protein